MFIRIMALLGVVLLIDLYAFQAVRVLCATLSDFWKNLIYISFWVIPFLLLIYVLSITVIPEKVNIYIRAVFIILYISKFVMIVPLLLEDMYRAVAYLSTFFSKDINPDLSRRKFVSTASLLLGLIPSTSLIYGMFGNQYAFRKLTRKIPFKNLPQGMDGLKIIQISDIHTGTFAFVEPLKNVVQIINEAKADVVVFTGDLVNSRADEALPFVDIFSKINAKYGVFSIMGNHDYADYYNWSSENEKNENNQLFIKIHKQMGWDLLKNEHRIIDIEGSKLGLIGVENYSTLPQFPKYGDLEHSIKGMPEHDFKLLLSHDPTHWRGEVLSEYKDINLTLSGHTHGFQFGVDIPGFVRWSPSQYVYHEWADLYKKNDQVLYVNRGLGCLAYPGRVGILPEITEIILTKS